MSRERSRSLAVAVSARKTDAELLESIARDDLGALGTLFDRHRARVARVLARLGVPHEDVDDIVQATFLEVPKIAHVFDGRDSSAGWLCGIASRLAARRRRSIGRFVRMIASFGRDTPTQYAINPENVASGREELALFAEALAGIGHKKREAFVLVDVEGFTAEEVSRALGVNAATVRTRLFHARSELRSALKLEVP